MIELAEITPMSKSPSLSVSEGSFKLLPVIIPTHILQGVTHKSSTDIIPTHILQGVTHKSSTDIIPTHILQVVTHKSSTDIIPTLSYRV